MVSPYLSRPLRSLREALESHQAPPRAGAAEARPVGGLLGATEAPAARPEAADSLTPPVAPRRPFTVVAGGVPGPSRGSGGA
jgi:hypothetical protein